MDISVLSLSVSGFRSFLRPTMVSFGDRRGFFLLGGRNSLDPLLGANGTGKSSLWGALCWVLYDKYPNNLRSPSLSSWQQSTKPETEVTAVLRVDGQELTVTRTWRPNGLLLNGSAATQDELDNILGCTLDQFLHSVYMGQGAKTFLDLSLTERSSFVSDLLGLDVWDQAREESSKRARQAARDRVEIEKQIERLSGSIDTLREDEPRLKQEIQEYEETRQYALSVISKRIDAILQKQKQLKVTQLHKTYDQRYKVAIRNRDRIRNGMADALRKHHQASLDVSALRDKVSEVDRLLRDGRQEDVCPTCGASLTKDHREKLLSDLEKRRTILHDDILRAEALERSARKEMNGFQENKDKVDGSLLQLMKEMAQHQDQKTNSAALQSELLQLRREWHIEQNAKNTFHFQDISRRRRLGQTLVKRFVLMCRRKTISATEAKAEFWTKGFGQIRLERVSEVMQRLENECAANLTDLGLPDWHIELTMDKENKSGGVSRGFHALVHSPHNAEPVPFESWSGGEAQRLRLAMSMGLSDMVQDYNVSRWGMEIWDEPCTWLSRDGIDMLLTALRSRSQRTGKAVWLVDHRALQTAPFDGVMVVSKDEHGSEVTWQS